jgi:hypothetical protein
MSSIVDYTIKSLSDFYTGSAIANAPKHTGRLPLSDVEEKTSVPASTLYAPEPFMTPTLISERINYRHTDTPLNTLFFSDDNVKNLQQQIKNEVLKMSGGKYAIDDQSEDDLKTIMRSYYLQYAQNNPSQVGAELNDLNSRVIGFSSNRIMVEVEAYKFYRKDIMDFPEPIARPIDVQIYGTRTGELKSFF